MEKLIHSENIRERLEKELESMGDLANRVSLVCRFITPVVKIIHEKGCPIDRVPLIKPDHPTFGTLLKMCENL